GGIIDALVVDTAGQRVLAELGNEGQHRLLVLARYPGERFQKVVRHGDLGGKCHFNVPSSYPEAPGLARSRLRYGSSSLLPRSGMHPPGNRPAARRSSGGPKPALPPPVPGRLRRSIRSRLLAAVLLHAPMHATMPAHPGWPTPVPFANECRTSALLGVVQGWPGNQAGRPFRYGLPKDGVRATAGSGTARDGASAVAVRPPASLLVATAPAPQALRVMRPGRSSIAATAPATDRPAIAPPCSRCDGPIGAYGCPATNHSHRAAGGRRLARRLARRRHRQVALTWPHPVRRRGGVR